MENNNDQQPIIEEDEDSLFDPQIGDGDTAIGGATNRQIQGVFSMINDSFSHAWASFTERLDWNETVQVCLAVFLVILIILTCFYRQ